MCKYFSLLLSIHAVYPIVVQAKSSLLLVIKLMYSLGTYIYHDTGVTSGKQCYQRICHPCGSPKKDPRWGPKCSNVTYILLTYIYGSDTKMAQHKKSIPNVAMDSLL